MQFLVDQVHLAKIWLGWVFGNARTVLDCHSVPRFHRAFLTITALLLQCTTATFCNGGPQFARGLSIIFMFAFAYFLRGSLCSAAMKWVTFGAPSTWN
jgi:hypothetical protein